MRKRRRITLGSIIALLPGLAAIFVFAGPAWAHGAMMMPGSRTYECYVDGLSSTGAIVPNNPACAAAVAQSGTTGLYNWFAVLRSDGAGRTSGFIPDGKLCSADSPNYDFSGYDLPRTDWPTTHLTSGAGIQIKYNKWAAHPGTFSLYVTKTGWDQSQPLTWDDFESVPFSTATDPPSVGDPGSISSYYYWDATLPAGLSGHHIIYSVWARSDSTETFYGCSDVDFDGGNGEVTGVGPGQGTTPPPTTAPPTTAPPTTAPPTTAPPSGNACKVDYTIQNTWAGGYQTLVTVSNPGTSAVNGWKVSWTPASGDSIQSVWNGTYALSGGVATVTNTAWNGQLAAGASTTFGFTANDTGTPTVPTATCVTS